MIKKKILITGGAGFIGSNFINNICIRSETRNLYDFVIADALTYAGNYFSIEETITKNSHISFKKIDIRDIGQVMSLFHEYDFKGVIHFAAESHVDRSIDRPDIFIETNVLGTLNLLKASLQKFKLNSDFRYLQIGTDEVYGSLKLDDPAFLENNPIKPNSPYSASKASADLFVRSYYKTYGLPILITRCSNNYGPYQHPEKLIPLMIQNACCDKPLPVYGEGKNIRDWVYVEDHNDAVWEVFTRGKIGEVYNIGGESEQVNLTVVKEILKGVGKNETLIHFVTDRLGHDFRYAMNINKIKNELNWKPKITFKQGLEKTIKWYLNNQEWCQKVLARS